MGTPRSRFSLLFVLLFLFISISSSPSATGVLEGTVVKIADGDMITDLDSDKVQHRVRIAGIDAPEKGQPFGNASTKQLRELVARKEVRVEFDKHDRYGRIVGKVMVTPPDCPSCGKTLDVGLAQITTGMARAALLFGPYVEPLQKSLRAQLAGVTKQYEMLGNLVTPEIARRLGVSLRNNLFRDNSA